MSLYSANAIVLYHQDLGDADKIITLMSREYGKIKAVARGVKRPRNRLIGGTQLFTYSEFLLFKGRQLDNISQCQIKESFFRIRDDFKKLAYTSYMAELVNEFVPEKQKNEEVFFLFLKTLYWILKNDDIELITRFFEIKLLLLTGILPYMDSCINCKASLDDEVEIYFKPSEGGFVCSNCCSIRENNLQIQKGTLNLLKFLSEIKYEQLDLVKLTPNLRQELEKILRICIANYLEKKLKSLTFLDKIKL